MTHLPRILLIGAVILFLSVPVSSAHAAPVVKTADGLVSGSQPGSGQSLPGHSLRRSPGGRITLAAARGQGSLGRGAWSPTPSGPACPQDPVFNFLPGLENQSEDCLHLNVWAPARRSIRSARPGLDLRRSLPVRIGGPARVRRLDPGRPGERWWFRWITGSAPWGSWFIRTWPWSRSIPATTACWTNWPH